MGGRWDATNVVDAPVAVITPIGIDHADYLGDDHRRHRRREGRHHHHGAGELVPADTVAVIGRQEPEAMEVLLAQAVRADAAVAREDSEFAVLGRQVAIGGQLLELQGLGGVYSEIFLPLHGEHQAHNAARRAGRRRGVLRRRRAAPARRRRGAGRVRRGRPALAGWNGCAARRRCSSTPRTIRPAPRRWRRRWPSEFDFRFLVGVLSVMADKDVDGILAALEPVFDQVVVTHNGSPRALDVDALALRAEERFGPERVVRAETLPRRHRDRHRAGRGRRVGRGRRCSPEPAS